MTAPTDFWSPDDTPLTAEEQRIEATRRGAAAARAALRAAIAEKDAA